MKGKTVLVVDDEKNIVTMLSMNLRAHSYTVLPAYDGITALSVAQEQKPDIILLDVMLPGMDGKEVCKRLKQEVSTRTIPVIMISAKTQIQDKLDGLSYGASDYITKPFNIDELILKIENAIRQIDLLSSHAEVFGFRGLWFDLENFQVTYEGAPIELTLTEFRILYKLISSPDHSIKKEQLANDVYFRPLDEVGRVMDVHIHNLRKKLDEIGAVNIKIKTIRKIGYTLEQ